MNNKQRLKKVIEEDLNKKNCYNKIIEKIDECEKGEKNNMKKNIFKISVIPVCLVIICGIFLINNYKENKKLSTNNISQVEKYSILNINEVKIDEKIENTFPEMNTTSITDSLFPNPYKEEISLPNDLTNYFECYIMTDNESNMVNNYNTIYYSSLERYISINYSKENKPKKPYNWSEVTKEKKTIINDNSLMIYKYNELYFIEFKYNEYNFFITTSKISEKELETLLISILK